MTTEQKSEDQQTANASADGWVGAIQRQYQKTREHAETYPYVWGSYIVVYGGFGLWMAYRWRKLRKTEDRIRALQARLRKCVEAEESVSAAASAEKAQVSSDKKPPTT